MRNPRGLMIFAAGFGKRMGALTAHRPKPLIEVAGRALIDHALALARGYDPIVVNLHYRGDQIAAHLAGRGIALSWEQEVILETGGGLRQALPLLGSGPVATLNADAVWTGPNPLEQLEAAWTTEHTEALLLLAPAEAALGHGPTPDFAMGPDGRLTRHAGQPAPGYVYLGAQILRTDGLSAISERVFSLNRLWDAIIAREGLFGLIHQGGWCDVGRPDTMAQAERLLRDAAHV